MKTILIYSFSPDDWAGYQKTLEPLFAGTDIQIRNESLQNVGRMPENLIAILASSYETARFVEESLRPGVPVIWINHTLEKGLVARLQSISRESRISVASDTLFYSESRRRMLINLGISEDRVEAWCEGMDENKLEPYVLKFENPTIKEKAGRVVIPMENRGLIGADTLMELLGLIGRLDLLKAASMREYFEKVCFSARRVGDILDIGNYYVKVRDKGVRNGFLMFTRDDGMIVYSNYDAMELLQVSPGQIYGRSIYEVLPLLRPYQKRIGKNGEELTLYDGKRLAFDIWNASTHGTYVGYMLVMDEKAESRKELRLRRLKVEKKHRAKYTFGQIIGESPAMTQCKEIARNMAGSSASVLITGPSGSGKELFAQAIHNASPRSERPFISVNCGALVETLLESELFGYEGGAFTGARKEGKEGLFELAHGGTLFLDEIGEMPVNLQVKLLRVLQEREVVRVGGRDVIPVDVRIIAATNRDLREMVEEGNFRLDLYYRLNVLPISLPGLNERREDIPLLWNFLQREKGLEFSLSSDAMEQIRNHWYEGNVREIQNCLDYLGSLGKKNITREDLPPYMMDRTAADGRRKREGEKSAQTAERCGGGGLESGARRQVLAAVKELAREGKGTGRRSIVEYLRREGECFSEMRVRVILKELEEEGLIEIHRGRGGVRPKR